MAELKTKKTEASVDDFLHSVQNESARSDCYQIVEIMKKATKAEPKMWGTSIVGFGSRHLKYESGRELDWMIIGFSPRKQDLTLYIPGNVHSYPELLDKLGKYKTGKGCLYIKTLQDVDLDILQELVRQSVKTVTEEKIRL